MTNTYSSAFLHFHDVHFHYPNSNYGVSAIDLRIQAGEVHCLVGRSGCGKSTLLKLAAGLLSPHQGEIRLAGQTLTRPNPSIGYVFQQPTLLAWLNVLDNVLLPAKLRKLNTANVRKHAQALIELLELSPFIHHHPAQLSGGQQSRVAIARALLLQPTLLLMDEPFAALDTLTREQLQEALLEVCQRVGSTVLFVTHDLDEAVFLAQHISVMQGGTIQQQYSVPFSYPRTTALRDHSNYLQHSSVLRQKIRGLL